MRLLEKCALLLLTSLNVFIGECSRAERQLTRKLFGDGNNMSYNPLIRPVRNLSESIEVTFTLSLIQLITLDEREQIMKSNVWLEMSWTDYQLQWDVENHDNISLLRVSPDRVWKPDLVLFNNADGKYEVSYNSRVLVYSSGLINQVPPAIYKSSCKIDVSYFPFDQQKCQMKFGSWTYSAAQVKLAFDKNFSMANLGNYVASGEWDIIECYGQIVNEYKGENTPNQTRFDYDIILRRKTLFYTINLITPCVLISFLSLCVFYLPAEASEKITLSISLLLALVVFLLLLQKILPPTSITIPLVAAYLLFSFILNIICIAVTVAVINLSFRSPRTHPIPRWIRQVFMDGWLPRILQMPLIEPPESDDGEVITNLQQGLNSAESKDVEPLLLSADHHRPGCPKFGHAGHVTKPPPMTREVAKTVQAVRFIASHLKKGDSYDEVSKQWRYVGLVIDRLLLIVFFISTVIVTAKILLNSPWIFSSTDEAKVRRMFSKE